MAAHSQPSPQAPAPSQSQSPEPAQSQADSLGLESEVGLSGGDEIADALKEIGYTPGDHNLEAESGEEGSGETDDLGAPKSLAEKPGSVPPTPPEPEKRDTVKPSALATFHRQQKDFFAQRQAFESEKAEIQKAKALIDNAKVDRIAALEAMGYTGENAITEFLQGLAEDNGRMTPERRELMELKKWRDSQETEKRTQAEQFAQQQETAQIQAKLDQIRVNVQNRIKSPEMAERLINIETSDEQVMREMDRLATETGEMPDIDVAISNVERNFQGALEQLVKNPAAIRFMNERLTQSKSEKTDAAQSKQREQPKTIGQDIRSPGTRIGAPSKKAHSDDSDLDEAANWLNRVTRK